MSKMHRGLKGIDGDYLQTNHLGLLEIESMRALSTKAFNMMRDLAVV